MTKYFLIKFEQQKNSLFLFFLQYAIPTLMKELKTTTPPVNKEFELKFNRCIVINSVAYFVMAYFVIVFSYNLFAIWIATYWFGFDAELYWHGFVLKGNWVRGEMVIVFFFGNSITLLLGFIFNRLYKKQRRYRKGIKLFLMWGYIIGYAWFFGNIIVGALFNFGIGTALRAFGVPFKIRFFFALAAVFVLVYIGYKSQKGVLVSANLYFKKLSKNRINSFLRHQILYPALIGTAILIIYKIPKIDEYYYMDWLTMFSVALYIGGLFLKSKHTSSLIFKSHKKTPETITKRNRFCKIQTAAIIVFVIFILAMRIGLNNGVYF